MTTPIESQLHGQGLRVTPGRLAVLAALDRLPHSDAETLCHAVRSERPDMSVQSVHNVLADLTAAGLVRRIEPARSPALYERRIGDNHHHIVCTGCGAVADVDCVHGSAPCLAPNDASGYIITTAEVTFWGLCASCQQTNDRKK
ncbi:Fur family transcriptional regulator [Lacisediminihabitans profunda]|uniref:Transcriptional repressor n=1 Tax=Lacisediminihabitans profunda TaxID=2594790 RepID=A0A5C8UKK6_9MICO|nr:Fur family transcriptional regulator [Lacisediminihabitans profunda]TXN28785.1 transcriptional repressor [Lacisediminihabitans profunda]